MRTAFYAVMAAKLSESMVRTASPGWTPARSAGPFERAVIEATEVDRAVPMPSLARWW